MLYISRLSDMNIVLLFLYCNNHSFLALIDLESCDESYYYNGQTCIPCKNKLCAICIDDTNYCGKSSFIINVSNFVLINFFF